MTNIEDLVEDFAPLTIKEFSHQALASDLRRDPDSLNFALLGLFGEIGSLLAEVKKKRRDPIAYRAYAAAVTEELGDTLWYLNLVADRGGASLPKIVAQLETSAADATSATGAPLTFQALQPAVLGTFRAPSAALEKTLIELAAEVGLLMDDQLNNRLENPQHLGSRLARIFSILIRAANEAGVTLEAAAVKNQLKISDRWPKLREYPTRFDDGFPQEEQLPRNLQVDIFERDVGGKRYVFQTCNGLNIGDRLTDNAMRPDDYRFHDAFHYAYVAVLGWSPVTRSLFRLKRKSMPLFDEAQDGARAALIEEGVTTWIFGQALEMDFFRDVKSGDLPFDILKQIKQFVSGYEADRCPAWLWEEAILQGYAAFRYLREHRRGRLILDAGMRQLKIEPLP